MKRDPGHIYAPERNEARKLAMKAARDLVRALAVTKDKQLFRAAAIVHDEIAMRWTQHGR